MKLKERFDAWVQGMVNTAVKRHIPCQQSLVNAVVTVIDYPRLIDALADNDALCEAAAKQASERLEDDIDTDEIARKVAVEIDVASCIDYDTLAEKLVEKLKEALV